MGLPAPIMRCKSVACCSSCCVSHSASWEEQQSEHTCNAQSHMMGTWLHQVSLVNMAGELKGLSASTRSCRHLQSKESWWLMVALPKLARGLALMLRAALP